MPTGPDQGSAPRASPRRASGSRNPSFEALGYPKPETVVRRARARRLACGKTEPMDLRHCLERLSTEGQPPRKSTCRRTPSKELQSFRRQRAGVMSNQRLNARMKDRGSEYPSSSEISAISLVEYSSRLRARIRPRLVQQLLMTFPFKLKSAMICPHVHSEHRCETACVDLVESQCRLHETLHGL